MLKHSLVIIGRNITTQSMASRIMETPTIFINAMMKEDKYYGFNEVSVHKLREKFKIVTYNDLKSSAATARKVTGAIVMPVKNYSLFLEQFPKMENLKIISTFSVGTNHLDLAAFAKRGILVSNVPDVISDAVADIAMALLLASARNLFHGIKNAMENEHCISFGMNNSGMEVTGSTIGIVGLGSIGSKIAHRAANGFNMNVLYYNRTRRSPADEQKVGATYISSLHEMLPLCDFVILACPLKEATNKLISSEEFSKMKKTSTLINIARGQIVDQDALLTALQKRDIRAAALDVTYPEPLPRDHPLLKLDNLIVSPHTGYSTDKAFNAMLQANIDSLEAVLINGSDHIPNLVLPSEGLKNM